MYRGADQKPFSLEEFLSIPFVANPENGFFLKSRWTTWWTLVDEVKYLTTGENM